MQALLEATQRESINVQVESFEAINAILQTLPSHADSISLLVSLQDVITQRLGIVTKWVVSTPEARAQQAGIQGNLCSVLWTILHRMVSFDGALENVARDAAAQHTDAVMNVLVEVLECHPDTVHQQALSVVGQVAWVVGTHFDRYMHHVWPFVVRALQDYKQEENFRTGMGSLSMLDLKVGWNFIPANIAHFNTF